MRVQGGKPTCEMKVVLRVSRALNASGYQAEAEHIG